MTYEEIFSKSKEIIMQSDVSNIEGHLAVQINITGEGEGAFYIELKDKALYVEPYEYYDRDCIFIITGENFLKIADGSLNPTVAFTTGKLQIEGSIDKALEFKKIVDTVKKSEPAAAEKNAKKSKSKKKR